MCNIYKFLAVLHFILLSQYCKMYNINKYIYSRWKEEALISFQYIEINGILDLQLLTVESLRQFAIYVDVDACKSFILRAHIFSTLFTYLLNYILYTI